MSKARFIHFSLAQHSEHQNLEEIGSAKCTRPKFNRPLILADSLREVHLEIIRSDRLACPLHAAMAELVDALDSGSSRGNLVDVRVILVAFVRSYRSSSLMEWLIFALTNPPCISSIAHGTCLAFSMHGMTTATLSRTFVWRRLHSLMGLWLVLFLVEHLLVNSQAGLLLGDNGRGFVEQVNAIHNLPYLEAVEIILLGVPIFIHMFLGIKYLWTAKSNASKTDGSSPALPELGRNRAYSWQRITSWALVVLLLFHIVSFRFLKYPSTSYYQNKKVFFVPLHLDAGLYTVADRLHVTLYDEHALSGIKAILRAGKSPPSLPEQIQRVQPVQENPPHIDLGAQDELIATQRAAQQWQWMRDLTSKTLKMGQVMGVTEDFGTASLLTVRDTFRNPVYVVLYTIFVLAACFHAFNGLWTFLITWGVIVKAVAQRVMVKVAIGFMLFVTMLGLVAIWGTYWLHLRY